MLIIKYAINSHCEKTIFFVKTMKNFNQTSKNSNRKAHDKTRYSVKIHTIQGYIQNTFLVEYDHGLLLLDSGARTDVSVISSFIINSLHRQLNELKLIVVTHMHPDHAGGAETLRELSGANIACHPNAPNWYSGANGRLAHIVDIGLMQYVAKKIATRKPKVWYSATLLPDVLLDDKQYLPEFEEWQVIYTLGHTNHDLSLFNQKHNKLYIADLMVWVKGRLHPPYPVCHPNQYKRSLARIKALPNPETLFAHVETKFLSEEDIDSVISLSSSLPKNHWLALKDRIKRAFSIRTFSN